jgi:hypothetical protein
MRTFNLKANLGGLLKIFRQLFSGNSSNLRKEDKPQKDVSSQRPAVFKKLCTVKPEMSPKPSLSSHFSLTKRASERAPFHFARVKLGGTCPDRKNFCVRAVHFSRCLSTFSATIRPSAALVHLMSAWCGGAVITARRPSSQPPAGTVELGRHLDANSRDRTAN